MKSVFWVPEWWVPKPDNGLPMTWIDTSQAIQI